RLAVANIARLDAQNLQNVLCEFDKYERAREKGGNPARKYKSLLGVLRPAKKARVTPAERITPDNIAALNKTLAPVAPSLASPRAETRSPIEVVVTTSDDTSPKFSNDFDDEPDLVPIDDPALAVLDELSDEGATSDEAKPLPWEGELSS